MRPTAVSAPVLEGRRRGGDGGLALVELAIMLPFLAVLICGVVDFGRYYQAWNETKNAAREGALYAERFPMQQKRGGAPCTFPNNITDKATQELSQNSSDTTFKVVVSPAVAGGCEEATNPATATIKPGATVTVTVSRHVKLLTPIMSRIIGNVDIRASVQTKVQG
jgi:Flp pilus assembly protein TadG